MNANAFTALAERQIAAPRKARMRAAEKRAATREQKALAERDDLHRMWKLYRQKQLDAALAGPYGGILGRLIAFLNGMTFEKGAAALIDHVRAEDWHSTDADTRFLALCIVSEAIMRLRKRAGLPEIDDGLPGERPNAFVIIREILR